MRRLSITALFALSAALLVFSSAHAAADADDGSNRAHEAVLVLDTSGSTWARLNGNPQMVVTGTSALI